MKKITNPSDTVLIDPNEPLILPDGTALVGRIEWFLYALCCLDYQNLPTPMSRIEEFANALITGEIPNIEPQSRAEQFFLAILDGNVSDLPQPQSRSEVLLDKLARGEFDLSDVEPIQSRYELLLAYLIKNGGIGNIDYVLYEFSEKMKTMYNTVEKPFKSLELSGNTLVNCVLEDTENDDYTSFDKEYSGTSFTINGTSEGAIKSAILSGSTKYQIGEFIQDVYAPVQQFKTGYYLGHNDGTLIQGGNEHKYCEDYIPLPTGVTSITSKGSSNWKKLCCYDSNKNFISGVNGTAGLEDLTLNIPSNAKYFRYSTNTSQGENEYINVVSNTGLLLASSNYNIPCELISCKLPVLCTTGKNLFDSSTEIVTGQGINSTNGLPYNISSHSCTGFLRVKSNTTYTITQSHNRTWVFAYNKNKEYIKVVKTDILSGGNFTTPNDTYYIRLDFNTANTSEIVNGVQIEEGSTATSYEPYKTNILTVNEPIELRRVGNVQDTLDLITGELVQRIGEIKITDEMIDKFTIYGNFISNFNSIFNGLPERKIETFTKNSISMVSDKMVAKAWIDTTMAENIVYFSQYRDGDVRVTHSPDWTLDEFKAWFRENKPTIQYELATPIVKTVDLNVVDQNNTKIDKIHVFDETTHVNASSDELTPTVNIGKSVSYPTIIKPNTKYTVDLKRNDKPLTVNLGGTEVTFASGETRKVITTPSTLTNDKLSYYGIGAKCSEIMLIEGEVERNVDYFTGMQSVVMQNQLPILTTTGKNLFNIEHFANIENWDSPNGSNQPYFSYKLNLKPNTKYTFSRKDLLKGENTYLALTTKQGVWDGAGGLVHPNEVHNKTELTVETNDTGVMYLNLYQANTELVNTVNCLTEAQIEESTVATTYEPYKTSILSCNDDVTLRRIGDVQDTLDCLTGEVTERVGEIVLDGSEDWALSGATRPNHLRLYCFQPRFKQYQNVINNRFADNGNIQGRDIEGVYMTNTIDIQVEHSRLSDVSVDAFKIWLSENPITIQARLSEKSIKTVALNVVDQDGNTIPKVKSHNGTTHLEVTVPKQSLLPNISAEVATDNSKDMSSLTVKHQEISETQSAIEDNIQSQSDEIDTALMATTEIFESILE